MDVGQAHTRVDGEVVHALLGLFDQRVAEDFPGQVFGHAAHLLERLVDGHRANRHGRVAHDPVACGVDVLAGREIHHVVGAPTDRPHQLFHFFFNARRDGRVADIGVDLDEEVAANRHRLHLGVVDVGRDDGAAPGHFVAHEFGRDDARDAGAHGVAHQALLAACILHVLRHPFALAVFADGHVFHFGGDDAFARVVHLRDVTGVVGTILGAQRLALQGGSLGAQLGQAGGVFAFLPVVQRHRGAALVVLHITTAGDPAAAYAGQALAHIDRSLGVGVRAGGVVHADHLAIGECDVAHRHAQIGVQMAGEVGLAGCGEGLARPRQQFGKLLGGGQLGQFGMSVGGVHGAGLLVPVAGLLRNGPAPPQVRGAPGAWRACRIGRHGRMEVGSSSAGMNRIKFVGFAEGRVFHALPHLSASAHPGAGASIGQHCLRCRDPTFGLRPGAR